jgi:presenilin-like A22 family membrane protease
MNSKSIAALPKILKIVAVYFLIVGLFYFYETVFKSWPFQAKPQVLTSSFYVAASIRKFFCILFVIPGIGLFYRKRWAKNLALVLIVLNTIFEVFMALLAFVNYKPPIVAYLGIVFIIGWNTMWFYIVSKKIYREAEVEIQAIRVKV